MRTQPLEPPPVNPSGNALSLSVAARVTLLMSCLFGATGVIMVFLPRWLAGERGLTGAEIGAVLSLAQGARIVTGPLVGAWADRARDRSVPIRIVACLAVLAYAAFFFFARGFWPLLVIGFFALSMTQAMTPLVEAATLRATAQGKLSYGVARGVGSISFILATTLGGVLVSRFGLGGVVVWVLSALALTGMTSLTVLRPDPSKAMVDAPRSRFGSIPALLRNQRFLVLILACGLIQSGHAFYYGFSTLVWRGQGISSEAVGLLWGFGVAVEVAFLWSLGPIERRVAPEAMILVGAAGGVVRWLCMGLAPLGLALLPLQALHALSFAATHVGAMRLVYRDTPEQSAAMAQALYAAVSAGVLMGGATLASGVLYDAHGARGYWAMALITAAGGLMALRLAQPGPRHAARD